MTETTARTFSEGEHLALMNDAVARESAADKAKITELTTSNTELQNKLDVLETEKAAAVTRADAAEKSLTDYKTEVETEKAREALRADRLAKVTEASPSLDVEDKTRADRIVAMSDEVFEGYLADLREVASKNPAPVKKDPAPTGTPRQSAALGGGGDTNATETPSVKGFFTAARSLHTKTA